MTDDDALAGLLLDIAELRQQVEALAPLRGGLKEVARAVSELRADLEQLAGDAGVVPPRVWSWPALDAGEAEQAWDGLSGWLHDILLPRYPEARRAVYPCWYRHDDVLDSLTALFVAWRSAYEDPNVSAEAAAVWLDRWLPAALKQLREGLRSCTRGEHTEAVVSPAELQRLVGPDFQAYRAADIAGRPVTAP